MERISSSQRQWVFQPQQYLDRKLRSFRLLPKEFPLLESSTSTESPIIILVPAVSSSACGLRCKPANYKLQLLFRNRYTAQPGRDPELLPADAQIHLPVSVIKGSIHFLALTSGTTASA